MRCCLPFLQKYSFNDCPSCQTTFYDGKIDELQMLGATIDRHISIDETGNTRHLKIGFPMDIKDWLLERFRQVANGSIISRYEMIEDSNSVCNHLQSAPNNSQNQPNIFIPNARSQDPYFCYTGFRENEIQSYD